MERGSSSRGYFADSESSDQETTSPFPEKMKHDTKYPPKPSSRRVTVRTPSEEDLFQLSASTSSLGNSQELDKAWSRRPPTPYALTRPDLYDSDELAQHSPTHTTNRRSKKNHHHHQASKSPLSSTPTTHSGIQPYNNPAGTTPQLGQNHVYHHVVAPAANSYPFPAQQQQQQPFVQHAAVSYAGQQPHPIVFVNKDGTMSYQNAGPPPAGLHFQPQTPDTTYGPMVHHYVPRHDGGGGSIAYAMQPGLVCPLTPSILSSSISSSSLSSSTCAMSLSPRRVNFATEPLVVAPAVAVAVFPFVVYPAATPPPASAFFMTTLGYSSDDKKVVPREIIVVR